VPHGVEPTHAALTTTKLNVGVLIMANSSLEQLHQIPQQILEKIHFKLLHTSAVLELLSFWFEESHQIGTKEVSIAQRVVWLSTDLLEEAIAFLPEV